MMYFNWLCNEDFCVWCALCLIVGNAWHMSENVWLVVESSGIIGNASGNMWLVVETSQKLRFLAGNVWNVGDIQWNLGCQT